MTAVAEPERGYDSNGNRTITGYTTGDHNRLLTDGTYTYQYDNEGNRTARFVDNDSSGTLNSGDTSITEYEWDHRNRLTKVTERSTYGGAATKIVEYAYDYGQRWVRKTLDTDADGTIEESQVFVHDSGQIVLDFQKTGTGDASNSDLAHRYLWGTNTDDLLADETVDDGSEEDVAWALTDHLGSVRDLVVYDPVTQTVSIVKHVTYDAYGNVTSDTATTVDTLFLYTARPFDPDTELQNNLNRWYDATTGRWMSTDPIGFEAGDVNLYRYVGNSVVNWIDPNGLQTLQPVPPIDQIGPPPNIAPPWDPDFDPLPPVDAEGNCDISVSFEPSRTLSTKKIRFGRLSGTITFSKGMTEIQKELCQCCCGKTGVKSKWKYSTSYSVSVSLSRSWGVVYDIAHQNLLPAKLFQFGVSATATATATASVDLADEFSVCPGAAPPVTLWADFKGEASLDGHVTAISQTLLWTARADMFGKATLSVETSLSYTSHGEVNNPKGIDYQLRSMSWGYRLTWKSLFGKELATGGMHSLL